MATSIPGAGNVDGASFVRRLARVRIEHAERELVRLRKVHRHEDLSRLDAGGDLRVGFGSAATRRDDKSLPGANAQPARISGMQLKIIFDRAKLREHVGFAGARQRVPLRTGAAARQQEKWKVGVGLFGHRARRFEKKFRLAVRVEKFSIGEKTALFERGIRNAERGILRESWA